MRSPSIIENRDASPDVRSIDHPPLPLTMANLEPLVEWALESGPLDKCDPIEYILETLHLLIPDRSDPRRGDARDSAAFFDGIPRRIRQTNRGR